MSEKIRIVLADDHDVVRRGLQALIGIEPDMEIVGIGGNGWEAVQKVRETNPDVVLLDVQMPQKSGIEAIHDIKQSNPTVRVLMLTSFGDDDMVFAAIKAGALGYLLKDSSPEDLLQAIRNVHQGRSSLHPDIALKVIQELNKPIAATRSLTEEPLTEREVEVLQLVARGFSNNDIADKLVVSERTVRTHISNILGKLHLANRTQAALYALREGIASLNNEG
jgi:NarL family two-component system response regulator LiaR